VPPQPALLPTSVALRSHFNFFHSLSTLCFLLWATAAFSQSEALTLPRNLAQLVDESAVVLQGRVTSVSLAPHPQLNNLLTVVVTLQVEDAVKGNNIPTYTFRQAVIDKRDQQQLLGYRIGQHLLLALIRPSAYGLSSPAGLQQGRFSISSDASGKLQATNGFGNTGLLRGIDSQLRASGTQVNPQVRAMLAESKPGPLPLNELKTLMRAVAARNVSQ
jgi:hypothetical protein